MLIENKKQVVLKVLNTDLISTWVYDRTIF